MFIQTDINSNSYRVTGSFVLLCLCDKLLTIRSHNEAKPPNEKQCNRTSNLSGMLGKSPLIRKT